MEFILQTIDEYEMKKNILLHEYRNKASTNFDYDITKCITKTLEIITDVDLHNVERYLGLVKFFFQIEDNNLVKQMLYEKLEQEYDLILDVQRKIGFNMQFSDPENTSIETIIAALEKIIGFMYPNKLNKLPIYNALIRLQDVHKMHSSIFMSTYENSIKEDYNKEVFKLTDEEIIAKNAEILENSKRINNGNLDMEFNNGLNLNNLKCSNE